MVHPRDGLYAWLVCICAIVLMVTTHGCLLVFGIIYPALLDEFRQGKAETAWVGSLASFFCHVISPLAAKLIDRYGYRVTAMVGSIIAAIALFSSSFVTSLVQLYVTHGVVFSVGVALTSNVAYSIATKYFKKSLGLATGMIGTSFGLAFISLSPLIEFLLRELGWRNTYRTLSGIALSTCGCAVLFSSNVHSDEINAHTERKTVRKKEDGYTPLHKNPVFILCCVYASVMQLGNNIPLTHLAKYAQDVGLTQQQASNLYVSLGAFSIFGRFACGRICDFKCINIALVCCFFTLIEAAAVFSCPFVTELTGLLVYSSIHGTTDGFNKVAMYMLMVKFCHDDQRTKAYGWLFFSMSWSFLTGPPLGGFIADQLGCYAPAFYTSGLIILLSACAMLLASCFKLKGTSTKTQVLLCEDDVIVTEKLSVL